MGTALLVWGWHNALLPVAIVLALIVELPRWVPWRWDLGDKDFHRAADLASVAFVLLAIYQFDTHGASGIYGILRWLPASLFLLAAAQLYSTRSRMDYTALFLSVRRAVARGTAPDPGGIDMRQPYLVVCLVSASGGAAHPRWLLVSLAALAVWMLAANRPARRGPAPWLATICAALAFGFALQTSFLQVRRMLEPVVMAYLQKRIAARGDPYRAYTAIGHIGELKLSNSIVMRVESVSGSRPPPLLREASYETFSRNMWVARSSPFEELPSSDEGTAWVIRAAQGFEGVVGIDTYMPRGKGLLAVPGGTHRLERLPVDGVYRNRLGALKVLRGPELVQFRARYHPGAYPEPKPGEADLALPNPHRSLLVGLAGRLGVNQLEDRQVVERVRQYFSRGFEYTLNLRAPRNAETPLADFLLESRRGHCEYFATATVLLLRAAGVPARYATGYSVQEWSELEQRYLVRQRHAHSGRRCRTSSPIWHFDSTSGAGALRRSPRPPGCSGCSFPCC
jgi:transglutaminase-like putative cysteine protease